MDFRVYLVLLVTSDLRVPWVKKVRGDFLGHLESKAKQGSAFRDLRAMSVSKGNKGLPVLRELASLDLQGLKGHRESKEREDH